jgi:hypothetical protein
MIRCKFILFLALAVVAAQPVVAGPASYTITAEQVAAAVTRRGWPVSADQIVLLSRVVASVGSPELEVKSIDRRGPQQTLARLECSDSEQCLPFVVSIRMDGNDARGPAPALSSLYRPANFQPRPASVVVRAGSPAVLLLEGVHIHIRLSVICLQDGSPGQTIQATDRNHRLTYTAQVTQDGVLEGRL